MVSKEPTSLTLDVQEGADMAGVSAGAIYEEIKRGRIPHIRIGRRIKLPRQAFEKFLSGSTV